jgi:uncharacterized DUF497 family protein
MIDIVYTMPYALLYVLNGMIRRAGAIITNTALGSRKRRRCADENSVEFFDPEHSETEGRFIRIGRSTGTRLLLAIFFKREEGEVIPLISARIATKKEERQYEKGI